MPDLFCMPGFTGNTTPERGRKQDEPSPDPTRPGTCGHISESYVRPQSRRATTEPYPCTHPNIVQRARQYSRPLPGLTSGQLDARVVGEVLLHLLRADAREVAGEMRAPLVRVPPLHPTVTHSLSPPRGSCGVYGHKWRGISSPMPGTARNKLPLISRTPTGPKGTLDPHVGTSGTWENL